MVQYITCVVTKQPSGEQIKTIPVSGHNNFQHWDPISTFSKVVAIFHCLTYRFKQVSLWDIMPTLNKQRVSKNNPSFRGFQEIFASFSLPPAHLPHFRKKNDMKAFGRYYFAVLTRSREHEWEAFLLIRRTSCKIAGIRKERKAGSSCSCVVVGSSFYDRFSHSPCGPA